MIDAAQPYKKYKASGVECLGEIPNHCGIQRMRQVSTLLVSNVDKKSDESELPVRLRNYVDVYKNDRITTRINFMRATAMPEEIQRFILRTGDVIITKDSEGWNDIGVPALVQYEAPDLICGYHLAILRARREVISPDFLFRSIQSQPVAYQFHVAANGVTRYGLSQGSIKDIVVPVPPLEEQVAIVRMIEQRG